MAEAYPGGNKTFKVTDENSGRTCMFAFRSYEHFIQKCKLKFHIEETVDIVLLNADNVNVEIDEDCLDELPSGFNILIKPAANAEKAQESSAKMNPNSQNLSGSETIAKDIAEIGHHMRNHIIQYGLKGADTILRSNLDGWKKKPLYIGVTGVTGKGKSSLINALRNLSDNEKGAAKVDVVECTTECTPYRYPGQDNFVLWDVPGAGSKSFPKESYLRAIAVDRFDFLLIVSSERFSEIDIWLAKEVRERNKRFYFIQTKTDVQMKSIKRRVKPFNEQREFKKLKSKTDDQLQADYGSSQYHMFMISNLKRCREKYDFPKLVHQLLQDVPSEKRMAMVFGVAGISTKVIDEKAALLKSRIWKVALMSGVGAAIPIPFVSSAIDAAIILEEVLFYREQFALDNSSLKKLAESADVTLDVLKKSVQLNTPADLFTAHGIAGFLAKYAGSEVAEKVVQYTIPVIGTPIACGLSFTVTMTLLENILNMMKADATKVFSFVLNRQDSN